MNLIPPENYVAHYDPDNPGHRRWLLGVLDHVTAQEPTALSVGPLRDLWTTPVPSAPVDELALARPLIREFESIELTAYPDPGTGGAPWTIGWGSTRHLDGRPVSPGDTITRDEADRLLTQTTQSTRTIQSVRIPTWRLMSVQQRAALISFAYNLGDNWYGSPGFTTLSKAVEGKDWAAVPKALELYRNPGTAVEAGLLRRRRAEGKMFASGTAPSAPATAAPGYGNPLKVYPYRQLDSATDQAARMCFSSSCAMLVEYLRPGTLKGPNGDDQYLQTVRRFGDTTVVSAQLAALKHYGITARMEERADFLLIERQIAAGIPVPAAYIHRGGVHRPTGFGHWLTIIGHTASGVIVHDPLGEPDLISGATLNSSGQSLTFSRENFGRRWMVEPVGGGAYRYAPGKGWAIIAQR
jgi:GH24 family phage-related lysozyme (muramidase)